MTVLSPKIFQNLGFQPFSGGGHILAVASFFLKSLGRLAGVFKAVFLEHDMFWPNLAPCGPMDAEGRLNGGLGAERPGKKTVVFFKGGPHQTNMV